MRYCPVCHARYDEEIIKFCTKDGTPLIEEDQPNFTALPSEEFEPPDDEIGQETVIRRRSPENDRTAERITIPTSEQARPRQNVTYYPPPPPQNNIKTIILTIIGTLIVLGFGALLFKMFQGEPANLNINTNPPNINANLNTNMGFDSNFNFNMNANFNSNFNSLPNFNMNANMKTPPPSPTPRPSVSPSASPSPGLPTVSPSPRTPSNTNRSSPSPTPRTGPRPPAMTSNRPPVNN